MVDIKGMRCNNCGWANPEGLSKCQKCNQTLRASEILDAPKAIIAPQKSEESVGRCLKCGYPLVEVADYCPNCGSQKIEMPKVEVAETVSVQNRKTVVLDCFSNTDGKGEAESYPRKEQQIAVNSGVKEFVSEGHGIVTTPKEDVNKPNVKSMNRTVIDFAQENSSVQDTRKTVVDSTEYFSNKEKVLPKETVADSCNGVEVKANAGATPLQYKLSCIDGGSTMDIVLQASLELPLKQGEVVLIGGLRYRVD